MRWIWFILLVILCDCAPTAFKERWLSKPAPKEFYARFETTHGDFDIRSKRAWSPEAVDRLYQLIYRGYFEDMPVYRVVPDYVAQFGINDDSVKNKAWNHYAIPDEPVLKENTLGTIAFARNGPNSRSSQLFINLSNNSPRLDTIRYNNVVGFPVVAEVIAGMDNVSEFFNEYENEPLNHYDSLEKYGNQYAQKHFPELDYIQKSYIIHPPIN
ncbi:MAG: peptidylprolyl isomerase [Cyclobacteriaceae bacterium]